MCVCVWGEGGGVEAYSFTTAHRKKNNELSIRTKHTHTQTHARTHARTHAHTKERERERERERGQVGRRIMSYNERTVF